MAHQRLLKIRHPEKNLKQLERKTHYTDKDSSRLVVRNYANNINTEQHLLSTEEEEKTTTTTTINPNSMPPSKKNLSK